MLARFRDRKPLTPRITRQMSSEASRLAVSIGGVEERVSSEAKLVQAEKTSLEKQKGRMQTFKVRSFPRQNFSLGIVLF